MPSGPVRRCISLVERVPLSPIYWAFWLLFCGLLPCSLGLFRAVLRELDLAYVDRGGWEFHLHIFQRFRNDVRNGKITEPLLV